MSKKSTTNKKKPTKGSTRSLNVPTVGRAKKAAAIVGQVLTHFGAGCGSTGGQIFATPKDSAEFSGLLMKFTMKNLRKIRWDRNPAYRDAVCYVSYLHGQRARAVAGNRPLTWKIIEETLIEIQKQHCPGGAGGGLVCGSE